MSVDIIIEDIKRKMATAHGFNAKVKFDFRDDGIVFVDTTASPPVVNQEDADADVTFSTSLETFKNIVAGTQDPTMAYMMGKLKIQGSMGLAMKLASILED